MCPKRLENMSNNFCQVNPTVRIDTFNKELSPNDGSWKEQRKTNTDVKNLITNKLG